MTCKVCSGKIGLGVCFYCKPIENQSTPPTRKTPQVIVDDIEIPNEVFKGQCCCSHDTIHGYTHGYSAGYAAAIEQAAKVAEEFAMENGPTHNKKMGGHAIAKLIRKLVPR